MHRLFFAERGIAVNVNGGFYRRGASYDITKKLEVAAEYLDAKEKASREAGYEVRPNITHVAEAAGVSWHTVEKIEGELESVGHVVAPKDIYKNRGGASGPGSLTFDEIDCFCLYQLYRKEPTRSLKSYVNWLFYYTGTITSESTVSRFFNHGFEIRGGLCKPNLVPYDKFRPANLAKAKDYLRMLVQIDPRKIRYCDEKHLKGKSIFNKKARRDVDSGHVPATNTDPDLRNTYSIIGICGICRKRTPVRFRITEATVDSDLFALEIEAAIASGFLKRRDVLVIDGAPIHTGKDNTVLEDWLWEYHEIFLLKLPARTPEWNPIELLWNCLEERLKHFDLSRLKKIKGSDRVVKAAALILSEMTHEDIKEFFKKCEVFTCHGKLRV